ncbi:MAG: hypothetical protein R8K20_02255, partial [Gallionellaceae bacterium]
EACLKKRDALDMARIDLLVESFGPLVKPEDVLNGDILKKYMNAEMENLWCMAELAVHPQVKGSERNRLLINAVLSIRKFVRKSELLVAGWESALATDAFIDLAERYLASLHWKLSASNQWEKIQTSIDTLRERHKTTLKGVGGNKQPALQKPTAQTEKDLLLGVLGSLQKRFRVWSSDVRSAEEVVDPQEGLVSGAVIYLRKAEVFHTKWDDKNCEGGSCAHAALANYQKAIEAEPLDWRGWAWFAQAKERIGGSISTVVNAYEKALSLIARCNGQENAICPKIEVRDHNNIRFLTAKLHLSLAHYKRAATLYSEGFKSHKEENPAQWGAVTHFAAEDTTAARTLYQVASETPDRFSRKGAIEAMLRSGFIKLSREAEKEGRLWDVYAHEQNIARIEAAADIQQRPKPYTTNKLIKLFNQLTWRRHTWRGYDGTRISPAMSSYAREHAAAARNFARRGNYYKARRSYRLALATDPWWVQGMSDLANVDFMLIGLCDAIPQAEMTLERLKQVSIDPVVALNVEVPLKGSLDKWREQMSIADRNAADYEPGYCDPDHDLPRRSIIRSDREVLVAPK